MAFTFKLEQADGKPADPPTCTRPYRPGRPATRPAWPGQGAAARQRRNVPGPAPGGES
jgi:hypothetical protein